MKKQLGVALLAVALTVGMASTVTAQTTDSEQQSNVNVNVASETSIDVKPDTLNYDSVSPGTTNDTSTNGFSAVEVENIGSEEIDRIWADASEPTQRPFGTGNSGDYDAGNFIQLSLETANNANDWENIPGGISGKTSYHYVNRVEWEEPRPSFVQIPGVDGSSGEGLDVGRFRAAGDEYYYVIEYDDTNRQGNNACAGGGSSTLKVANEETTSSNRGTTDFTSDNQNDDGNDGYTQYTISDTEANGDDTYGKIDGVSVGDRSYVVLTHCDVGTTGEEVSNGHTIRTAFNTDVDVVNTDEGDPSLSRTGDITGNTAVDNLLQGSSASNVLQPGQSFPVDMRIEVPQGVTQGSIGQGTLTIMSTANFDAVTADSASAGTAGSDGTFGVSFSESVTAGTGDATSGLSLSTSDGDDSATIDSLDSGDGSSTLTYQTSASSGLSAGTYEVSYNSDNGDLVDTEDGTAVGDFTVEFTVS